MPISLLEAVVAVAGASILGALLYRWADFRWKPLAILGVFWATGIVVGKVMTGSYIDLSNVFDTHVLHDDQIVALLGVLGLVGALWAELSLRRRSQSERIAIQA